MHISRWLDDVVPFLAISVCECNLKWHSNLVLFGSCMTNHVLQDFINPWWEKEWAKIDSQLHKAKLQCNYSFPAKITKPISTVWKLRNFIATISSQNSVKSTFSLKYFSLNWFDERNYFAVNFTFFHIALCSVDITKFWSMLLFFNIPKLREIDFSVKNHSIFNRFHDKWECDFFPPFDIKK